MTDNNRSSRFPGEFESLPAICDFASGAAEAAGLNEDAVYEVQLAVDEACANIIEHAYGGEGNGEIECSCRIDPDKLTMVLRDHGRPFDPDSVPEPDTSSDIEERKARGLGLYLLRKLMDEVRFEFTESGNVLTLVKRKERNS
jgi:serine/threonine-protein kinase RsbW